MNIAVPTTTRKGATPRTKIERYCLEHSSLLPPLKKTQLKWAKMKPTGIIYHKGRASNRKTYLWCQNCGRVEEISAPPLYETMCDGTTLECHHCGATLTVNHRDKNEDTIEHDTTFGIVSMYDEWQIIRWFNWRVTVERNVKPQEHIEEVMQLWVDLEHNKLCLLNKPYTNSFYRFRWHHGEDWKVRKQPEKAIRDSAYTYYPVFDLTQVAYYPHCQIIPTLKRNGWEDRMAATRNNILDLWRALYNDPIAESLAKWRQFALLYHYVTRRKDVIQKFFHAIRVCNRHGYIVRSSCDWLDYMQLMEYFHLDTHNPKLVAPDDLNKQHDILFRRKERIEAKRRKEELLAQAVHFEEQYKKYRGMFFGTKFNNDDIYVHVISSVQEMAEEGEAMRHCVYTNEYFDCKYHPDSLILSARDAQDKRLETVEVSIKKWCVVQSRSVENRPSPQHQQIVDLVNSQISVLRNVWLNELKRRKKLKRKQ